MAVLYYDFINKYVPKKAVASTNINGSKSIKSKGKYNKEIAKSIKKKHRLWQRYIETKDGQKYIAYVQARNKTKSLITAFQRRIGRQIAQCVKTNPKKFWSHVNKKTKLNSEISNLIKCLHPDGSASLTNSLQEKT